MRSAGLLLLTMALAACGRTPCEPRTAVQVPTAPPAPLDEPDSKTAIAPGMAWIPGYWHWDDLRWLWVPGHWESPRAGQRWYPPRYAEQGDGRHYYRAGAFGCIDDDDE